MAVTKQIYTVPAPWTDLDMATALRSAFIDAGLMTEWHDSFNTSTPRPVRVLKIEHDGTKTYGASFYSFMFDANSGGCWLSLASGWNASGTPPINIPTGTQYLDYERLPSNYVPVDTNSSRVFSGSTLSNLYLDRYTSNADTRQSWFVFRQGVNTGVPFAILHKDTALHSWLDLSKGIVNGHLVAQALTLGNAGFVNFRVTENLRRCLLYGHAVRGNTNSSDYHSQNCGVFSYMGIGSGSNATYSNLQEVRNSRTAAMPLPIGKNASNPAYLTDDSPICSDIPWSPFTATRLAADFGVYMCYPDNTIAYGDKFIVENSINEWEVLGYANNTTVNDGASACFVARII
jgi:hypothetical protein